MLFEAKRCNRVAKTRNVLIIRTLILPAYFTPNELSDTWYRSITGEHPQTQQRPRKQPCQSSAFRAMYIELEVGRPDSNEMRFDHVPNSAPLKNAKGIDAPRYCSVSKAM